MIVVTGMPRLRAASVIRCTSGVLFWLLKTQTLICLRAIWRSIVVLSAAVGSVPSLIAFRNEGGVSRFEPERLRERREDALGRADRDAVVACA